MDLKHIAWVIVSPIGLFSSLILIVTTCIVRRNKNHESIIMHLSNIIWMSFADLGYTLSQFLFVSAPNLTKNSISCLSIGIGATFFSNATKSWYFIIGLNIVLSNRNSAIREVMKKRWITHLYVWGSSCAVAFIPFHHYVRYTTGECWIDSDFPHLALLTSILFTLYLLFSVIILASIFPIFKLTMDAQNRRTILFRTLVFVFVFVMAWLPTWVSTILKQFHYEYEWLEGVSAIARCAIGLLNFIVWFLFFPELRNESMNLILMRGRERTLHQSLLSTEEKSTGEIATIISSFQHTSSTEMHISKEYGLPEKITN